MNEWRSCFFNQTQTFLSRYLIFKGYSADSNQHKHQTSGHEKYHIMKTMDYTSRSKKQEDRGDNRNDATNVCSGDVTPTKLPLSNNRQNSTGEVSPVAVTEFILDNRPSPQAYPSPTSREQTDSPTKTTRSQTADESTTNAPAAQIEIDIRVPKSKQPEVKDSKEDSVRGGISSSLSMERADTYKQGQQPLCTSLPPVAEPEGGIALREFSDGIYEGALLEGQKHGKGTMLYKDSGSRYIGEWEYDKKHGMGLYVRPDGSKYEGFFINNERSGQGTLVTVLDDQKLLSSGQWKNDKMNGEGYREYINGNKYYGYFKDSKRHGEGKMLFANGAVYWGRWKNNQQVEGQVDTEQVKLFLEKKKTNFFKKTAQSFSIKGNDTLFSFRLEQTDDSRPKQLYTPHENSKEPSYIMFKQRLPKSKKVVESVETFFSKAKKFVAENSTNTLDVFSWWDNQYGTFEIYPKGRKQMPIPVHFGLNGVPLSATFIEAMEKVRGEDCLMLSDEEWKSIMYEIWKKMKDEYPALRIDHKDCETMKIREVLKRVNTWKNGETLDVTIHKKNKPSPPCLFATPSPEITCDLFISTRFIKNDPSEGEAKELRDALADLGLNAYMVEAKPGEDFGEQVMGGLNSMKTFVALCSSNYGAKTLSNYSTYNELKFARDHHKHIVPIRRCKEWPPQPTENDLGDQGKIQNKFFFSPSQLHLDWSSKEWDAVACARQVKVAYDKRHTRGPSGLRKPEVHNANYSQELSNKENVATQPIKREANGKLIQKQTRGNTVSKGTDNTHEEEKREGMRVVNRNTMPDS